MKLSHAQYELVLKKYVQAMPTFSPATAKILRLANQLNTPANEIVAAIRMDPILTGKVLQLVNSAYFSLASKVTGLNRALVYLGINTIKNLALSTAVMEAFNQKDQQLADAIAPVWRHSLATAVCAKGIAKALNAPANTLEEFFIAGLLHDLGKIVMMQAFFSTTPHPGMITVEEEKATYGLDHGEVGAQILERWKFPAELVAAMKQTHSPLRENRLSCILHLADEMTYQLGLNGPGQFRAPAIQLDTFSILAIDPANVETQLASAAEEIEKAEIFLNIANSKEKVVEQE
jgi:putative nucleotidyltransferase with HDIG domain